MGEPKAQADDDANQIEDAGEPAVAGANPVQSASIGSDGGSDAAMRIELDLLTYECCLRIADAIARRCVAGLGGKGGTVLVAAPGAAAFVARAGALQSSLAALRARIDLLATVPPGGEATPPPGGEATPPPEGEEKVELEVVLPSLGAITGGVDQLSALLTSVKGVIDTLAVVDAYDSRDVAIDPATLVAVVAGRCLKAGLKPVVIAEDQLPLVATGESALLAALAASVERLRSANPADPAAAEALLTRADAVLDALRGPAAGAPLALLDLIAAHPHAPLLTVKLLAAGGASRTRTHLFTALGLVGKLSISAGAAIQFALSDRGTGALLAGDLLFDSSGSVCPAKDVERRRIVNLNEDLRSGTAWRRQHGNRFVMA